nr:amine oxidase [Geodermatophilaceae bacterium]
AVLPKAENARASWNYLMSSCGQNVDRVQVTYWMNKLQQMDEPVDYLVTLNSNSRIDQDTVLARMVYDHPLYTPTSVAAQRKLASLNTGRTGFAGAYHGWGFHEDGCAAGVRAAKSLGVDW